MAKPPSVENLATDIVPVAEAQSLRHETLELPVAEPDTRSGNNSQCLNCKTIILSNETRRTDPDISVRKSEKGVFGVKKNPVRTGIALPVGQGHNKGMLP